LKRYVIDASVAIKWYVPEVESDRAARLLTRQRQGEISFHVPDLFLSEVGNIVWKKCRAGELEPRTARAIASALIAVPKTIYAARTLLPSALDLALASHRTVYDCMYVALAVALDGVMITADGRLRQAFGKGSYSPFVAGLEGL
jgi:predicted nucleic acid-binding protein